MRLIRWVGAHAAEVAEAKSIMKYAFRADEETMESVLTALRDQLQGSSTRTQVEVDGVIARWRAEHPHGEGGGSMFGPTGPGPA